MGLIGCTDYMSGTELHESVKMVKDKEEMEALKKNQKLKPLKKKIKKF